MKFQVTFDYQPDELSGMDEESLAEEVESEVEGLLMDAGYSNIDCKAV